MEAEILPLSFSRPRYQIPYSRMPSSSFDENFRSEDTETNRIAGDIEDGVPSSSCGCFYGFGSRLSRGRSNGVRCRYLPLESEEQRSEEVLKESWMMKKVRKIQGIIKAVAGRKWRNFIHRIINKKRSVTFQYDPRSYALNFDDGIGKEAGAELRHLDFRMKSTLSVVELEIGMMNRGDEIQC